jgi:hypothetical protein
MYPTLIKLQVLNIEQGKDDARFCIPRNNIQLNILSALCESFEVCIWISVIRLCVQIRWIMFIIIIIHPS